ncbi:MAG: transketolase C-terminal domain-containing protein [Armatimonadota bacterium]|nr:transketolase C-terminal domain-containing protein [Armatimonadota bacterium]
MITKERIALTGNEAAAMAMRQVNPDVVAAYPITPQTEVMQIFASYVADGLVNTELVTVESEHSAMSATIGAAAAGARAMTATSSQGLALMWEMLYIAAGLRLPIVMPMVNRALSAPINIHCDHSDSMGARDSGWLQIFSENAQEIYDNIFQAIRIAEHPDIQLPVMVNYDGFIISHGMEPVEVYDDKDIKAFIGEYVPKYALLDVDHPITVGSLDLTDFYFEHKRSQAEPMFHALPIIEEIGAEFGEKFGRKYGLFEEYYLDDAELAIVVLGSTAGTAKVVINELRKKGIKAGMLKLRVFRPFPEKQIAEILSRIKAVAVLDRSDGMAGTGGPVYAEVRSALYDCENRPTVVNYIYGLGGRDINLDHIASVFADLEAISKNGKRPHKAITYLGVRE